MGSWIGFRTRKKWSLQGRNGCVSGMHQSHHSLCTQQWLRNQISNDAAAKSGKTNAGGSPRRFCEGFEVGIERSGRCTWALLRWWFETFYDEDEGETGRSLSGTPTRQVIKPWRF